VVALLLLWVVFIVVSVKGSEIESLGDLINLERGGIGKLIFLHVQLALSYHCNDAGSKT